MLYPGDEPVSGYKLVQFLGRGGFGEVWKATGPGGTFAALKIVSLLGRQGYKEYRAVQRVKQIRNVHLMPITAFWLIDTTGKVVDDATIARWEALASQADPGFSAAVKAGSDEPQVAELIVAMLLGDKNLTDRLAECKARGLEGIPPDELIAYMEDAAKGIDYLNSPRHDLGTGPVAIQHCDIKPQNIMLMGENALVCDFGLAKVLGEYRATSSAGSMAYVAPEVISGNQPSRNTDQYSLAISYYELRTGELPFVDQSYFAIYRAHVEGKLELSRLPAAEQAVIKKATSVDPDSRYPTTVEMARALKAAIELTGTRPLIAPPSDEPASREGLASRRTAADLNTRRTASDRNAMFAAGAGGTQTPEEEAPTKRIPGGGVAVGGPSADVRSSPANRKSEPMEAQIAETGRMSGALSSTDRLLTQPIGDRGWASRSWKVWMLMASLVAGVGVGVGITWAAWPIVKNWAKGGQAPQVPPTPPSTGTDPVTEPPVQSGNESQNTGTGQPTGAGDQATSPTTNGQSQSAATDSTKGTKPEGGEVPADGGNIPPIAVENPPPMMVQLAMDFSPPDAVVRVNGVERPLDNGRLALEVPENEPVSIEAQSAGYEPFSLTASAADAARRDAVNLVPTLAYLFEQGRAAASNGDLPGAEEFLVQVLARDPKDAQALALRGHVRDALGLLDDAADDLKKAAELSQDEYTADAVLLVYESCRQRGPLAETDKVLDDLDWIIHHDPAFTAAYSLRSRLQLAHGQPALAEKDLQSILSLAPDDVETLLDLAEVEHARGLLDAARGHIQQAARLAPENARAGRLLALMQTLDGGQP
jgi:serine/threonine protein kinase/tetratricopeptide (TPR) repeat protein